MVSASAPSVYSVQALSLLAEVSHARLLVPRGRGPGRVCGRAPGRAPGTPRPRAAPAMGDFRTTVLAVCHLPQKIAVSFGPALSGPGVSPGHGVSQRREGEGRAAHLPLALLRFPVLTQSQVTAPLPVARTRGKAGHGAASRGFPRAGSLRP